SCPLASPGCDAPTRRRRVRGRDRPAANAELAGRAAVSLPTHEDVIAAHERIARLGERAPLIETDIGGARLWLKCECLQTGGAFKLRGATNRLLQLSPAERQRGVRGMSARDNPAQAVRR